MACVWHKKQSIAVTITSFPLCGSLSVEPMLSGQIKRASHVPPVVDPIMRGSEREWVCGSGAHGENGLVKSASKEERSIAPAPWKCLSQCQSDDDSGMCEQQGCAKREHSSLE
ncbi:hypothetical protein WMY93_011586 [Mugilogobius chulae]|uniref:Uncharacterized protein n=1 Tax=Mugilogobius chulae TaxID=88201 RepID=A0AAW0P4F1_9GOBI